MRPFKNKCVLLLILTILILVSFPHATADFDENENIEQNNFDQKINFLMKIGYIPSLSGCIIENDTIVSYHNYGHYDLKNKKEPSKDTVYQLASVTKTFTAIAILQLYEKGLLNLTDNVNDYLPFNLTNPRYPDINITFEMLLSHTSSLNKNLVRVRLLYGFLKYPYDWLGELFESNGDLYTTRLWRKTCPGESFFYSNIGFEILGCLVEKISNETFESYCKNHIFTPLKMYNTSFHFSDFNYNELAIPYIRGLIRFMQLPFYDFYPAAGGIRTTVEDLSHYLIAHINKGLYEGYRILNESNIELMHSKHSSGRILNYGFGWMIWENSDGELYGGHGGKTFGCRADMRMRSSDKTGVIILTNQYIGFDRPREIWARNKIIEEFFSKC